MSFYENGFGKRQDDSISELRKTIAELQRKNAELVGKLRVSNAKVLAKMQIEDAIRRKTLHEIQDVITPVTLASIGGANRAYPYHYYDMYGVIEHLLAEKPNICSGEIESLLTKMKKNLEEFYEIKKTNRHLMHQITPTLTQGVDLLIEYMRILEGDNEMDDKKKPTIGDPSTYTVDLEKLAMDKVRECDNNAMGLTPNKPTGMDKVDWYLKYHGTISSDRTIEELERGIADILALYAYKAVQDPNRTITQLKFEEAVSFLADLRCHTNLKGCDEELRLRTDRFLATWIMEGWTDQPFDHERELMECLAGYQKILIRIIGQE